MKPIVILIAVLSFSTFSRGQIQDNADRRLLDSENHIVTVAKKDDSVVFTMEAITDFTEDRDNTKPLGLGWDFAGIRVDINNNNVIDNGVDVAYGIRQKTNIFCSQFIIRENASSGCGVLRSKGRLRVGFEATPFQPTPHPVYVFAIPFSELSSYGGKIGLVFTFFDPQTRSATYPNARRPRLFEETIQLDLAEL